MNIWCIDYSDKMEAIRSLFISILRTITADAGSLFHVGNSSTESNSLELLCRACSKLKGPKCLPNHVTEYFLKLSTIPILYKIPNSKDVVISCCITNPITNIKQICALLIVVNLKNDTVSTVTESRISSIATSIATLLCNNNLKNNSKTDIQTEFIQTGTHGRIQTESLIGTQSVQQSCIGTQTESVHGMIMEAQRLYDKTKSMQRTQDVFLANMSHELRGPLHNIIGTTRLLESSSNNMTPQQCEYLDIIDHNGLQLLNIISDILDYTKLEAGEMTLKIGDFMISNIIDESVNIILFKAREKALDVCQNISKNVPKILIGDGPRIQQIVVNLLSNAIKFTEQGRIRIVVDFLQEISELDKSINNILYIIVEDTGIGIPRRYQQRVFETFSQVDNRLSRKTEGSGLGLAIVKKLVSIMGGSVNLVSRCIEDGYLVGNTGTELHIKVPIKLPEPSIPIKSKLSDSGMKTLLRKKSIIVYDQDFESRAFISDKLMEWSARVIPCATVHEVIKYAESKYIHVDLYIIDCSNTSNDSHQLINILQPEDSIIIELHSSSSSSTLMPADANRLYKPVTSNTLQSIIQQKLQIEHYNLRSSNNNNNVVTKEVQVQTKSNIKKSKNLRIFESQPKKSRKLRILVVEDNSDSRIVAVGYLKKIDSSMTIHTASNGQEAIDKVIRASGLFDLILMDIRMPVMNGFEATKKIREIICPKDKVHARNYCPLIVAFTATLIEHETSAIDGTEQYDMTLFDGFVGKPLIAKELEDIITLIKTRKNNRNK